jgi:hypothetical protein
LLQFLDEFSNQSGFAHPWKACDEDILSCQPYDLTLFEIAMNSKNASIFC